MYTVTAEISQSLKLILEVLRKQTLNIAHNTSHVNYLTIK